MNSDISEIWSIKLAEVSAPDEIDLAPLMTESFIRSGKERESLFSQQKKSVLGGFGATEVTLVFPFVLQSIVNAAEIISKILSPVTPMKTLIEILNQLKNNQEKVSLSRQETEVFPEELYTGLKTLLEMFTDEISKSGLPKEKCEIITYHIFLKLFEDPSSFILFLKAISANEKSSDLNE